MKRKDEFALSDESAELIHKLKTDFSVKLARLTADVLVRFKEEERPCILVMLQDETSLYSPFTADHIREEIYRMEYSNG